MDINWKKINQLIESDNDDDIIIALELLKASDVDPNDPRIHAISWNISSKIVDDYFNDNWRINTLGRTPEKDEYIIYSWK